MKRTAIILALVVAAVLGIVWASLSVMHQGYSIEEHQARRVTLLRANKELEIEIGRLSALDRIERIAALELGMIVPRPNQLIQVRPVRQGPLPRR